MRSVRSVWDVNTGGEYFGAGSGRGVHPGWVNARIVSTQHPQRAPPSSTGALPDLVEGWELHQRRTDHYESLIEACKVEGAEPVPIASDSGSDPGDSSVKQGRFH